MKKVTCSLMTLVMALTCAYAIFWVEATIVAVGHPHQLPSSGGHLLVSVMALVVMCYCKTHSPALKEV